MLDRVLSTLALAQAIIVTLRAGSKIILLDGLLAEEDMLDDLPQILPSGETSVLFELTTAFRQSVRLGLKLDEYESNADSYKVVIESEEEEVVVEPYCLSLVPVVQVLSKTTVEKDDGSHKNRMADHEPNSQEKLPFIAPRNRRQRSSEKETRLDWDESWVAKLALKSGAMASIRAYAPYSFFVLRSYFGIPNDDVFRKVVLESGPFCSFQSNSKGAARSGGIFFLTRDGSYLIKTIKRDEMHTLKQMLPMYIAFMKANGQRSLLNRFCGLYEVSLKEGDKDERLYFVIVNSVFSNGASKLISERFDLKGSTVGRKATIEEKLTLGPKAVLKDLDLMEEVKHGAALADNTEVNEDDFSGQKYGLHIGLTAKEALLSQLRLDVGLLQDCSVIDYSLLVGVAIDDVMDKSQLSTGKKFVKAIRSALRSKIAMPLLHFLSYDRNCLNTGRLSKVFGERNGQPVIYYFGLIDFLQPFDYKKELEYRLKGILYKKGTYSCVPPGSYAERFLNFVDKHVT